jgi:hypothetical protein
MKQKPEVIHGRLKGMSPIKKIGKKQYTSILFPVDISWNNNPHIINVRVWHNQARYMWDMWESDVLQIGDSVRLYGYFHNEGEEVEYFNCNTFEKYNRVHSSNGRASGS